MLPREFQQALRRHGPALAHWPSRERRAALRLLRVSARARDALSQSLDFPGPVPGNDFALARMRAVLRQRTAPALPLAAPRLRWAALAACAVAGIWLGLGGTDQVDAWDVLTTLQVAAIGQVSQ